MSTNVNRRKLIKQVLTGSAAIATGAVLPSNILAAVKNQATTDALKGNINHSACRWCYSDIPTESLAKSFKQLGMVGMDLVGPSEWKILKDNGLTSTMCNGAEISLTEGFNTIQYHDKLVKNYIEHINYVADAGYTNLICFSGSRRGMDDETGLNNCVTGLKKIMALAEKRGVVIQMELLNSRVDHKDYMCDRSSWGVELCKRLGSPNFKLLFDIYHMQIDEGDIIHSINTNHAYYGHYHTGGVPGRNEIDERQELYYPAIMRAILKTGFKGYVAQEFIPADKDPIASLAAAIKICDV
ncbi:MAG: TIM barrel protein [Bacteroidetes bacterium]|nr:TIM barrel protein [Bacteroidota bacterium]